jgi:hypothetical protein
MQYEIEVTKHFERLYKGKLLPFSILALSIRKHRGESGLL